LSEMEIEDQAQGLSRKPSRFGRPHDRLGSTVPLSRTHRFSCRNAQRRTYIMNYINKLMVRVRESKKGQTMTEYVLIIAAIAVAGYIAYQGLEGGINTIISNVTTTL